MNKCAIVYVPHLEDEPYVEIVGISIDGRDQDMSMVPKYVLEAAEAWAEAVERAKEDEAHG